MKTIKRELAHVGMFGPDGVTITRRHLADCQETFDGKCPITIGHRLADWMPKFGNVRSVELQSGGDSLVGNVELHDLLADAVDSRLYEDISVGIQSRKSDGKHYLHHLAFLGAVPPKIRDLRVFADLGVVYCGDEESVAMFADSAPPAPAATEPAAPDEVAAALQSIADKVNGHAGKTGEEEDVELKEENDRLKAENERQRTELADSKAVNLAAGKEALKKAMEGKVPKAKQGLVLELADRLDTGAGIELADENGSKEKVPPLEILRRVLEAIPKAVAEGRADLGDQTAEPATLDLAKIQGKF